MTGSVRLISALAALLSLFGMAAPPPAAAAIGAWIAGENVRLRLVATGIDLSGKLSAGLELELAPGWKTYWINPGEAGIPPLADFSGSENVGPVSVAYPVPHRTGEGESLSNVYEGRVVFALSAAVDDPSAPIRLSTTLDLGVCEKVCIPVNLAAALEIDPGATDISAARLLAEAAATMPGKPEPGRFAVESLTGGRSETGGHVVSAVAHVPDPAGVDLFVAGPEGWYVGAAEPVARDAGTVTFRFPVEPHPTADISGGSFQLVLVSGGKAVEQTIRLDD